jgi:hypothetical protein
MWAAGKTLLTVELELSVKPLISAFLNHARLGCIALG